MAKTMGLTEGAQVRLEGEMQKHRNEPVVHFP